ncbi:hypothetical protein [Amycolatopsis thermophila]|uniref:Secreted protein n=1 Tax=Amycolatopsis thermophila TaxID=206084 RepID=A0ABU0ENA1_9PSEU|nr:hypothetical protein [Amycolatopsis thermophila]MDQ0376523.1 hypothetical protein [Amycolatopsis thermophila]
MKKRTLALAAALAAVVATTTACDFTDKITEPFNDAPRSQFTDSSPADIITMPDGFSNLATKCVRGNRYTVAYHGDASYGSISVVPNDPTCTR